MSRAGLQRVGTEVAIIDGIAIALALGLAALGGEFDRTVLVNVLLLFGFLMMLGGGISTGTGGWSQAVGFGGAEGLNYVNVMNEEMLLQQELQTPHGRSQRSMRIKRGLTVALAGFTLTAIAVVVSYV